MPILNRLTAVLSASGACSEPTETECRLGHMLWPHYCTCSRSINGVIDRGVNSNIFISTHIITNLSADQETFLIISTEF